MLRATSFVTRVGFLLSMMLAAAAPAQAAEVALLETPVKVSATLNARAEGGFAAQIGVHTGPIAQLVSTTVMASTAADAERLLRNQVQWRAPYLFIHSSCGYGRTLRCEGETVFRMADAKATRLGDLIGSAPAVYDGRYFLDVYDKLEGQLELNGDLVPRFVIVLDDAGRQFAVNAAATWSRNAEGWRTRSAILATGAEPGSATYLSALLSNAALARYCNRHDELQQVLSAAKPGLTAAQMRMVTDALSKVVPLEAPRAWRNPY